MTKKELRKKLKKEFFQHLPPAGEIMDEDLVFTGTLDDLIKSHKAYCDGVIGERNKNEKS